MNIIASADKLNARSREARRIDSLIDEQDYDSPHQVAIRRFQAAVVLRRQLSGAVSNAEFTLDRANEARLHAGTLLGLAEGNAYGGVVPVVTAETRLRMAIRAQTEAETAYAAAVAALDAHDAIAKESKA